jgi:hypothetical protein
LASGLPTLARIAGSAVQTLVVTRDRQGLAVRSARVSRPTPSRWLPLLEALAPLHPRLPRAMVDVAVLAAGI